MTSTKQQRKMLRELGKLAGFSGMHPAEHPVSEELGGTYINVGGPLPDNDDGEAVPVKRTGTDS